MIDFSEVLETIAHAPIEKRPMTNHDVLNEAFAYAKPSSFSRGMRIDLNGITILLISGTASIDENGVSVHISCGGPMTTSPACSKVKVAPGTTSCAPPATSATSTAITRPSTKSARSSSTNRASIRCLLQQEFKLISAGRNSSSKSKRSPCSARKRRRS